MVAARLLGRGFRYNARHCSSKRRLIDGGIAVEQGSNRRKIRRERSGVYETSTDHGGDVFCILSMRAFNLRKRLGVQVEVVHRDPPALHNERASLLPTALDGNEVNWRRELDVNGESLLELGKPLQNLVALRVDPQVDVQRRLAPPIEHGAGPAGEVDPGRLGGVLAQSGEKLLDSLPGR